MGDFYQNGIITTLHNLADRPLEELERGLELFSRERPLGLILPSLYSELEGDALPAIVEALKPASYLSEIVIGLDRATDSARLEASVYPMQYQTLRPLPSSRGARSISCNCLSSACRRGPSFHSTRWRWGSWPKNLSAS